MRHAYIYLLSLAKTETRTETLSPNKDVAASFGSRYIT